MDGYRQSLLGRALADALQDLEKELGLDGADVGASGQELDGDVLFSIFDEAMQLELRDKDQYEQTQTFTHDLLRLTGKVTAFNRFTDDWSVLARMRSNDIKLDNGGSILHLPHEHREQEVTVRLKLRKQTR